MRSRAEILHDLENLDGSRQGDSRVLRAMLEVLLDLREMLGVEIYLTPPAEAPEREPFNAPRLTPRNPRLPMGPKAQAPDGPRS